MLQLTVTSLIPCTQYSNKHISYILMILSTLTPFSFYFKHVRQKARDTCTQTSRDTCT